MKRLLLMIVPALMCITINAQGWRNVGIYYSTINTPKKDLDSISDILKQGNTKLKQILWRREGSKIWYITVGYEYDSLGRISKVSNPKYDVYTKEGKIIGLLDYEIYFYNAKNQLEEIKHYGSITCQGDKSAKEATYKYSYDKDGNKIKEVREYIMEKDSIYYWVDDRKIGYSQIITDSILNFYDDNGRLKRQERYEGEHGPFVGKLTSFSEYEYDLQGKLVAETAYSGKSITKHIYQKELMVKTEHYWSNEMAYHIKLFYNKKGNLIYLEFRTGSRRMFPSFDLKYEYDRINRYEHKKNHRK